MSDEAVSTPKGNPAPQPAAGRVVSVDVLRGFDMFWLVCGAIVATSFGDVVGGPVQEILARQFEHAKWEGFYFYDLIFPLFVFLAGMSIVFSMGHKLREQGRSATILRHARRCTVMFLLGILYNGGFRNPWPDVRLMGVLQRIALASFFAGVLFCFLDWRGLAAALAALLLGYWALLSFVPIPGHDAVSWDVGVNWAVWIDSHFLPGKILYGPYEPEGYSYDPEGYISTIPAIGTCLLGVLSALYLKSERFTPSRKAAAFFLAGLALAAAGYLWGYQCPIIKKLWTPTYVFVAGGYSVMLVGIFYYLVDVRQSRWWTAPFIWIGVNPLTLYLANNLVDFTGIAKRLVGGGIAAFFGELGGILLIVTVAMLLKLLFVWFLNKKRIYLRL